MSDRPDIGTKVQLPAEPPGWFDYLYAVLMDGRLAIVRVRQEIVEADRRTREAWDDARVTGGRPAPTPPAPWPAEICLSVFDGLVETDAIIVRSQQPGAVGRLADGLWLVVSWSRDRQHSQTYHPDGSPGAEIDLGRGVEHLQCSPDGSIWVGYGEESILSGRGPDGEYPVAKGGIVQFDAAGRVLWSFNDAVDPDGTVGLRLWDCPPFSLTGSTLWASVPLARRGPGAESAIVRFDGKELKVWNSMSRGGKQIAASADIVLHTGFHFTEADRIVIEQLADDLGRETGGLRYDPIVRAGWPLLQWPARKPEYLYGFDTSRSTGPRLLDARDGVLQLVESSRWTRINVDEAAKAADPLDAIAFSQVTLYHEIYPDPSHDPIVAGFGELFFARKPEG